MLDKKILVAEDEKPLAKALELKLVHSGYVVTVVNDGETALQKTQTEAFDMIITDLMMPKMDGFTFLKNLRAGNNKTPVIVLSNLSQEVDKQKVLDLGALELFVKSNTPLSSLVDYIRNALR